jgi:hypothetical protein
MPSVGADIESICGKCGDVWHVVVAVVGDRVAKVECKMCGKQHRYRPPGGSVTTTTRRKTTSRKTSSKTPGKAVSNEPLIAYDENKPVRPYGIKECFAVGDRISHSTFGTGVVELEVGPGKIQVFFPSGRRVMAHQR